MWTRHRRTGTDTPVGLGRRDRNSLGDYHAQLIAFEVQIPRGEDFSSSAAYHRAVVDEEGVVAAKAGGICGKLLFAKAQTGYFG